MKMTVGIFDSHLDDKGFHPPYGVVKKFIKHEQPNRIVIGGDFMDLASLSHWNEKKRLIMEGKRFTKEVKIANQELDFLQENSEEQVYIEGNHENWVEQYIERHPEMEGVLNLPIQLRLEERGIKWIPRDKKKQ